MNDTTPTPASPTRFTGLVAGLAATAAALGAGELAAAATRSWFSPIEAVALSVIDLVPGPVERWAISTLGTADKPVLIVSTIILSFLIGAGLGVLALRRRFLAAAGFAAFAAVGVAATNLQSAAINGIPSIIAGAAGAAVIILLATRAAAPATETTGGTPMRAGAGSRRGFLALSGGIATAAGVMAAGGRALTGRFSATASREAVVLPAASETLPALPPGVDFDIDGLEPFVTPFEDFYRIDTALTVPQVPVDSWRLRVTGMVERELELTYDDLLARNLVEADITLTCVSNEVGGDLISSGRWTGVLLRDLLADAGVDDDADQIVGRSVDDWTAGFPVDTIADRDAMVAIALNGEPLPIERGFPARLIVPGLYGYVSATKWLEEIELTRFDTFDQYWVERGWEAQAPIKTQSKFSVPRPLSRVPVGPVELAGVAWAQRRGISKVEVRVEDGDWMEAELAQAGGIDTWRQWRLQWTPESAGNYRLTVRATDGEGNVQTEERQPPFPDGATGWMTLFVTVAADA